MHLGRLVCLLACLTLVLGLQLREPRVQEIKILDRRTFSAICGSGTVVYPLIASASSFGSFPPPAVGYFRLFLARHGETENNRLGIVQGRRVDAVLNPTGVKQAEALAERLAGEDLGAVFSSSLRRAKMTADILAAGDQSALTSPSLQESFSKNNCPRIISENLDEVDFGTTVDGQRLDRVAVMTVYERWIMGDKDARFDGGETAAEIIARIRLGLREMADVALDTGRPVAAVSHSGLLRWVLAVALNIPLGVTLGLDQRNCCLNVVDIPFDSPVLQSEEGLSSATWTRNQLGARLGKFRTGKALEVNGVDHLKGPGLVSRKLPLPISVGQKAAALAIKVLTK